ncbi:hypothetical protein C7H09_18680 [Marinobacter fuscus]|uniref:Uncharacterized protein n=1 Tax=Marinobacter fuscus TaxID=2109942 RepID=A0A2T1K3H4_9GAMM|nr:hypothetical protein [Marinobacter fuscus]PSF04625.1 hypothetical protein C7H09_18680 [Marinobacter fuscus]
MEPIRPDNDELRAERPTGATGATGPKRNAERPNTGGAARKSAGQARETRRSGGGRALIWLALIAVGGAAGAGWYGQSQRIAALESQLEEADYWARQSKLALARFEGELSETGESLQERGATLEEKIAANAKEVSVANSEIRKLWVVANERNRKQLEEQAQALSGLDERLAAAGKSLADLTTSLEQLRSSLSADIAQLDEKLGASVAALEQANREAVGQITTLTRQIGDVDKVVENRIRRFEQEQRLGSQGLEARLAALEGSARQAAGAGELASLRKRVGELARTVESIDASRAQLTSRLVRLSEEVNQLRSRSAAQ